MRGLRLQLAAVAIGGAICALVLAWLLLVPGLGDAVRDDELGALAATAARQQQTFQDAIRANATAKELAAATRTAAADDTVRVAVVGIATTATGRQLLPKADSAAGSDAGVLQYPAALNASVSLRPEQAVEAGPDGRIGQAAVPLTDLDGQLGAVLVVSRPLADDGTTDWATERLALAAGLGLLVALTGGLLLAVRLTRRIGRLEAAAERVAAGDLQTPFPSEQGGEFGALSTALEGMRKQLAELDSARKRFIATASHELRTPLFSLGGFLELLEDEDVSEADRRRFVVELRQQVERMQHLATELLDLSRIDSGSLELRDELADLRELVRTVAQEFAPRIAAHEAHLELRLPDEPLMAQCDPERVMQILRILIANAITHTPKGTDIVVAAATRGSRARISVADHGPGISRSVLPTIFEPFTTTDDMQGAGLGLAIARELSVKMSGELRVESRPGLTRFTLDLVPG